MKIHKRKKNALTHENNVFNNIIIEISNTTKASGVMVIN